MSDLKKYIATRKKTDKAVAEGFEEGLTIGLRIPYKHLSVFDALVRPRKSVD
jgi:hypothetical protein